MIRIDADNTCDAPVSFISEECESDSYKLPILFTANEANSAPLPIPGFYFDFAFLYESESKFFNRSLEQ